MDSVLVVVRPFGQYKRGDVIDNPTRVTAVLGGEHAYHVVRVAAAQQPAPQRAPHQPEA
jgi:hypothetical protein